MHKPIRAVFRAAKGTSSERAPQSPQCIACAAGSGVVGPGSCGVLTPIPSRSIPEQEKRLQALWSACEKLPKANYNNIR